MRAKIVPDLMDKIESCMGKPEGHRTDPQFMALCGRIAGKEVDLTFTAGDAFEEIDDNYFLPDCCWTPVGGNRGRPFDCFSGRCKDSQPHQPNPALEDK